MGISIDIEKRLPLASLLYPSHLAYAPTGAWLYNLSPEIVTAGWLLAASVFLWNFSFVIYPQSQVTCNVPLRFALAQHDKWPFGTPIAFHNFNSDLWTIREVVRFPDSKTEFRFYRIR